MRVWFESDPAVPDIHGDAVTVVVDARGHGEEGDPAGVAVLVVGAVSVVVEAVHEHAAVVNLAKSSQNAGNSCMYRVSRQVDYLLTPN